MLEEDDPSKRKRKSNISWHSLVQPALILTIITSLFYLFKMQYNNSYFNRFSFPYRYLITNDTIFLARMIDLLVLNSYLILAFLMITIGIYSFKKNILFEINASGELHIKGIRRVLSIIFILYSGMYFIITMKSLDFMILAYIDGAKNSDFSYIFYMLIVQAIAYIYDIKRIPINHTGPVIFLKMPSILLS